MLRWHPAGFLDVIVAYVTCIVAICVECCTVPAFHETFVGSLLVSLLMNTLMNVVSLSILASEWVVECPVLGRLSRAPRDRPRPHDRAMSAHSSTSRDRQRKNGRSKIRRAGGVEKKEPSPIPYMAGDRKSTEISTRCRSKLSAWYSHTACVLLCFFTRLSLIHI